MKMRSALILIAALLLLIAACERPYIRIVADNTEKYEVDAYVVDREDSTTHFTILPFSKVLLVKGNKDQCTMIDIISRLILKYKENDSTDNLLILDKTALEMDALFREENIISNNKCYPNGELVIPFKDEKGFAINK